MSRNATRSTDANFGAHGPMIAGTLQFKNAPSFTLQRGKKRNFAATLVKSDILLVETLNPIPPEDAFIASVSLEPSPVRNFQLEDEATPLRHSTEVGLVTLMDLREAIQIGANSGIDLMHFYFTKSALNGLNEDQGGDRIDVLKSKLGISVPDTTLHCLASALLPAFDRPKETSTVFVNNLMLAAGAHILKGIPRRRTLRNFASRRPRSLAESAGY